MNIAMEHTEVRAIARPPSTKAFDADVFVTQEYVNGQLKNKYGDAFIRGNNGA